MNRRGFITGLISLVAAPAIVRAGSLMPVKTFVLDDGVMLYSIVHPLPYKEITFDYNIYLALCREQIEEITGINDKTLITSIFDPKSIKSTGLKIISNLREAA